MIGPTQPCGLRKPAATQARGKRHAGAEVKVQTLVVRLCHAETGMVVRVTAKVPNGEA